MRRGCARWVTLYPLPQPPIEFSARFKQAAILLNDVYDLHVGVDHCTYTPTPAYMEMNFDARYLDLWLGYRALIRVLARKELMASWRRRARWVMIFAAWAKRPSERYARRLTTAWVAFGNCMPLTLDRENHVYGPDEA